MGFSMVFLVLITGSLDHNCMNEGIFIHRDGDSPCTQRARTIQKSIRISMGTSSSNWELSITSFDSSQIIIHYPLSILHASNNWELSIIHYLLGNDPDRNKQAVKHTVQPACTGT